MAKVISAPTFSDIPASGKTLLEAMTADTIWKDATIQYYFGGSTTLSADSQFQSDYNDTSFAGVTPDATYYFGDLTVRAFQMIGSVIPKTFVQTNDLAEADEVLISARKNTNLEGFSTFPGTNDHDGQTDQYWSLNAFNSQVSQMVATPEVGGGEYANWTVIHEIGHSLGLYHPFEDAAPYIKNMDNERYTVMSYTGASNGLSYGHAVSMMALDVAALQQLYGKSVYAETNSTYTLNDPGVGALDLTEGHVAIGRAYYCIWDSGGTDTINYGGVNESMMINLNAATLETSKIASNVAGVIASLEDTAYFQSLSSNLQLEITDPGRHAGGFFSRILTWSSGQYSGVDGGFSIANGAKIENATGAGEQDLLIGNEIANKLLGLGGQDTLLGSGGNDKLYGGEGDDTVIGGTGNDLIQGGVGTDELTGGTGKDRFQFIDLADSIVSAFDTIGDFIRGTDLIDLGTIDANSQKKNDQAFTFIGAKGFSGKVGELHYVRVNDADPDLDVTYVEVDRNGDKVADMHIELSGLLKLHATDFIL